MNIKVLAENLGFDVDSFLGIMDIFVGATLSDLEKMKRAMEEGAPRQVAQCAHSIKGAASNFEFEEIYERAKGIEIKAGEGLLDGSAEAAAFITERLDLIRTALKNYRDHHSPDS